MSRFLKVSTIILLVAFILIASLHSIDWLNDCRNQWLVEAYRVKSTTDPSFECSGCARTRLIGCFHGQCSYRCYRSCTNGTSVVMEAHRFVLEGQRRRRKRFIE